MGEDAFNFPYTLSSKPKVIKFIKETDYSNREASAVFHTPDSGIIRIEEKTGDNRKTSLESKNTLERKMSLKKLRSLV